MRILPNATWAEADSADDERAHDFTLPGFEAAARGSKWVNLRLRISELLCIESAVVARPLSRAERGLSHGSG